MKPIYIYIFVCVCVCVCVCVFNEAFEEINDFLIYTWEGPIRVTKLKPKFRRWKATNKGLISRLQRVPHQLSRNFI